jgi:hypothetical protein
MVYGKDNLYKEASIGISLSHHKIHNEQHHVVTVVDTSMGATDTLILAFKTHATKQIHVVIFPNFKAAGHIEIIEGPTWTTNTGVQVTARNRNRISSNVPPIQGDGGAGGFVEGEIVENPTGLSGGTVIPVDYSFVGNFAESRPRDNNEFILKKNTQYAIRLTADAATNAGFIKLDFYETTEK